VRNTTTAAEPTPAATAEARAGRRDQDRREAAPRRDAAEERRELEETVRVFQLILEADPSDSAAQEALREAQHRLRALPAGADAVRAARAPAPAEPGARRAPERDEPGRFEGPEAPARRAAGPSAAEARLAEQPRGRFPLLGELMVGEALITRQQLGRALAEQRRTGEKLGQILVRLDLIDERQLTTFLSKQYQIRAVGVLTDITIADELLQLVPAAVCRKHDVLPLAREGARLTIAMADATDVAALDDIAFVTNLDVDPVLAPRSVIRQAIEHHYAVVTATATMPGDDVEILEGDEFEQPGDVFELKESADEAPIIKLVNAILAEAVDVGASDIHWEPYESTFRVRFRIDGLLHERWSPPKRFEPAVISRLKIMAALDIAERRLPQDGRIRLRHRDREVDLRVSTLPTAFGEKCVIRLLDKESITLDLGSFGFDPSSLAVFTDAIRQPYGMILITGPTGSGKTTTLYAAINAINAPETNILTVEDPIEYNLRGVNQVQVNEGVGRTFAVALRAFLRQDPDIILVGETRDLETAQIAVRAALTGHLVFSTLHTNDCPSTITRLVDMGIPAYLVASSLVLIVAQRLVRQLCTACREPYEVSEEALAAYGHVPTGVGRVTVYRRRGCDACNQTGMKGRTALYELMPVSPEVRDLVARAAPLPELRRLAQQQHMRTLRQAGLAKVLDGVTTIDELLRVTLA
jgi:type IV pilus assembly protein PilB